MVLSTKRIYLQPLFLRLKKQLKKIFLHLHPFHPLKKVALLEQNWSSPHSLFPLWWLGFQNPFYLSLDLMHSHIIDVSSLIVPIIFLQKAAACTHIHYDHLNVALACLYCSGKENPKMQWFSASAWENHIHKHSQAGLPLFPSDPAFTHVSPETLPSTSGSTSESLPLNVILERAKAARQCLEEESKAPTFLKHLVKQGPIKKSKIQRDV